MNKRLIIKIITVSVIFLGTLLSQKAVNAVSILNCSVSLSKSEYTYDGTSKKPTVVIKYNGKKVDPKNYKLEYVNNIRVGTATVNITGKNTLNGRITKSFKIKPLKLTSKNVNFRYTDSWRYTGKEIKPALKIIFHNYQILESNYNIKYENNVKLGKAKIIITGKNNCSGKVTKTFKIYEDITKAQIEFNESNYVYSGNEIKPNFKLKIHNKVVDSKNYSVKFSNNINASNKAKITITGKNNYRGELTKTFTIEPYDLSNIIIFYTLKFQ